METISLDAGPRTDPAEAAPSYGTPLRGLRVLELAAIGPVPYACMLLADLGAEVIRVDRPGAPRAFGDWHRVLDRGRRSTALDLKDPAGVRTLLALVEEADVLIEGYRPGVTERLGIGPAVCLARNPRLVYGRMTGWGQDGPLAHAPGHDINYIALSGALDALGRAEGPPAVPLNLLGDFAGGGLPLAFGVLAALYERRSTGRGQVVDTAITDGTASLLGMLGAMAGAGQWEGGRGGNVLDSGAPYYDVYPCADGRYVAVGALEERFYRALLDGLGLAADEVPDREDPANWPALRALLGSRFAARSRDEWAAALADTEACVTPVLTLAEAADHPHHRARGTYRRTAGGTGVEPGVVPRFGAPGGDGRPVSRPEGSPTTSGRP
ncbi:CaiB/BaiF CoA transferase family protein [Streptomyces sp. CA-294286]|uniref:CaiB/BaiF CoA transferase family protein n=1 Tax=Streptomyces sp. CA-294286 TaxID=3240070 RepID=UPI003D8F39B9